MTDRALRRHHTARVKRRARRVMRDAHGYYTVINWGLESSLWEPHRIYERPCKPCGYEYWGRRALSCVPPGRVTKWLTRHLERTAERRLLDTLRQDHWHA